MKREQEKRVISGPYDNLKPKEKAYVDAIAEIELERGESPDSDDPQYKDVGYSQDEVLDRAEELLHDDYKAWTSSDNRAAITLRKERRDLIEERKQVLANDRGVDFEGEQETKIVEGPDGRPEIDATMQYITERPIKNISEEGDRVNITISLPKDQVFDFVREADEETAKEIWEQLV